MVDKMWLDSTCQVSLYMLYRNRNDYFKWRLLGQWFLSWVSTGGNIYSLKLTWLLYVNCFYHDSDKFRTLRRGSPDREWRMVLGEWYLLSETESHRGAVEFSWTGPRWWHSSDPWRPLSVVGQNIEPDLQKFMWMLVKREIVHWSEWI